MNLKDGMYERLKRLMARPFCPTCHLFLEEHNDDACDMRWEPEEELCASSVLRQ
jgi:hypothetical protein